MKSVRNLSIPALTLLTVLFFSFYFYGCQKESSKETNLVTSKSPNQDIDVELRGCEYSLSSIYPALVNGQRAANHFAFAVKSDKSTFTNERIVWRGDLLTAKGLSGVNNFIEITDSLESMKLRRVIGLPVTTIDSREAHHIIPMQHWGHLVVRIAGLNGFHPTQGFNGIPLSVYRRGGTGLHANHPAYNTWIKFQLDEFQRRNDISKATHRYLCNSWVQCRLIPEAIKIINSSAYKTERINETFKRINKFGAKYIDESIAPGTRN